MTTSNSASETFTKTHATYLASKVTSDLYQCAKHHGSPEPSQVDRYRDELIEMLTGGYLEQYEFGFKKDGIRVICWRYSINFSGDLLGGNDDRSGGIHANAKIDGASYYNFMTTNRAWSALTESQKHAVRERYGIFRETGTLPKDGVGHWETDKNYSNGGLSVSREVYKQI